MVGIMPDLVGECPFHKSSVVLQNHAINPPMAITAMAMQRACRSVMGKP